MVSLVDPTQAWFTAAMARRLSAQYQHIWQQRAKSLSTVQHWVLVWRPWRLPMRVSYIVQFSFNPIAPLSKIYSHIASNWIFHSVGCTRASLAHIFHSGLAESLQSVCDSDSAVAGEAASLSMGLVMLGSGHTEIINKMLEYAHNTDHEKIIRG